MLCVYVTRVVANTVFPIFLDMPEREPHWKVYFGHIHIYGVEEAVQNIVVFAPDG